MRPTLVAALMLSACACFFAAAHLGTRLVQRAQMTARIPLWQLPLSAPRASERPAPPEPRLPEEELREAELILDPAPARRRRPGLPPRAPPVVIPQVEPADAMRLALRSKRASFEHCYEQELKKQATFSGFIVIALSLSAEGMVTEARVEQGNRRDAAVGACIVSHLRRIKLPPLTSEADLLIPIRLQAREPS